MKPNRFEPSRIVMRLSAAEIISARRNRFSCSSSELAGPVALSPIFPFDGPQKLSLALLSGSEVAHRQLHQGDIVAFIESFVRYLDGRPHILARSISSNSIASCPANRASYQSVQILQSSFASSKSVFCMFQDVDTSLGAAECQSGARIKIEGSRPSVRKSLSASNASSANGRLSNILVRISAESL